MIYIFDLQKQIGRVWQHDPVLYIRSLFSGYGYNFSSLSPPFSPVMFKRVQTDRIHKEMTRRVLSGSTVFKTCVEMLLEINFVYREENTCTE